MRNNAQNSPTRFDGRDFQRVTMQRLQLPRWKSRDSLLTWKMYSQRSVDEFTRATEDSQDSWRSAKHNER